MTIINPKSIAGVTSITTPSGSDNLFTVHTNNTTERIRINNDGDVIVGSGITVSPDGDIFATGVCTATSFVGSGANLTGVASTENIRTNTNATFLQNINVSGSTTTGSLVSSGAISGTTGTFTGNVDIADKIVHTGDTDTAIRFSAADTISIETGGVTRATVSGNNIDFPDAGTLRFGAGNDLQIYHGTGGASNIIHSNTSQPLIINASGAGTIRFDTDSTERVRIDSSGRLMIGTTTEGFATYGDKFTIANSGHCGMTIRSGTSSYGTLYFSDGDDGSAAEVRGFVEYNHSTNSLSLGADGTSRQVLDSSGNLKFNSGYGSVKEAYGVRAWANYDHVAATIRGSAQLTSVTDTSTGRGTLNWAFTFVDQYYAAVGTSGGGGGDYGDDNAVTWSGSDHGTTTLSFRTDNFKTNANHDSDNLNVVIVR